MQRVCLISDDPELIALVSGSPAREVVTSLAAADAGGVPHAGVIDLHSASGPAAATSLASRGIPVIVVARDEKELELAPPRVMTVLFRPVEPRALRAQLALALRLGGEIHGALARVDWLTSALSSTSDAILTTDPEGIVTYANAASERLLGREAGDILGVPIEERLQLSLGGLAPSDRGPASVLRVSRADGSTRLVAHDASPIVDPRGTLQGVVVVLRDVTEQRELEARLAIADRLTSVGRLAAGIAHEINNPLAFVTSNLEFGITELQRIAAGVPAPASTDVLEVRAALKDAAAGAARATQIVKDMRMFTETAAHISAEGFVDVDRVIQSAARIAGNEVRHRATLELKLHADGNVRGDEGALTQVFVNLLTNAAHAVDPASGAGSVVVRSVSDGDWTTVEVSDTGHGIPSADLPKIFDPFFTTKPVGQGTGLGLAFCHTVIAATGGTISCTSAEKAGTTFAVRLPRTRQRGGAAAPAPGAVASPIELTRVLVIDDEELIGSAVRRILSRARMEVTVETDGRRAVERLRLGETFDVVICDLMMPGFSGADVHDWIVQHAPATLPRLVLMTGTAFTTRESELFNATENVRIEKPFVPDDLTRAVSDILGRHGRA